MKTSTFLLAALIVLTLASCQSESNDPPIPPEEVTTKMLVYYKFYENGALDYEGYARYYLDTPAKTLYKSYDTVNNIQEKFVYDANGRLIKKVYPLSDTDPSRKDSVIITRPSVNTVVFTYVGPNVTYTAVTTDLAGGRKRIHIETQGGTLPNDDYWIRDLYMSADGKLDSSVRQSMDGVTHTANITQTRRITWNASGTTLSIADLWDDGGPNIWIDAHTITRDNHDNAYMETFIRKLWGSDLGWGAYNFEGGLEDEDELFSDFYMTDNLMVMKGSLLTYSTSIKQYNKATGAVVTDDGTSLTEYPPVYYSDGKLKSTQEIYDGEVLKTMDLKYYN